jgi:glycosyltransferase involved in cell wall biosynthesis
MMIKTFCTVFKNLPKGKQPGLILKTSSAGFSVGEREQIHEKITHIIEEFGDKCPPIYLIFGDLTESEMNELYNDSKVKAMISFTKGEGYGRPLAEFATTGKPILVSKWSGHTDFLPENNTNYLSGEVKDVHASASNQFLLKESKWFYVDYSTAAQSIFDVHKNYDSHLKKSKGLSENITTKFSLTKMTEVFKKIIDKYIQIKQKVDLILPQINKL